MTADPAPRPDGLHVTVDLAGYRGVLSDPAGRTFWTCRHTHPEVAQAHQCAERERELPGLADLGFSLRQLRAAAGMSQEQVAAALECSTSKVSRIETGEVLATTRDVRDLAGLYGANPKECDALVAAARPGAGRPRGLDGAAPSATRGSRQGRRCVSRDRELYAALLGLRRRSPRRPLPLPDRAPPWGPVEGREPGIPPRTDAPPTAKHPKPPKEGP